jgi:hypothetical protein
MSEPPDFRPDDDAVQVADALRSGTAIRSAIVSTPRGEDEARLQALGDLESLTTVAKPGALAPLIKAARRALHVLARPWLAMQTIYNREVASRFQRLAWRVHDLDRRVPHIERNLRELDERLALLQSGTSRESGLPANRGVVVDMDALVRLFVQSHLPVPPARILISDKSTEMPLELASFGFDVVVTGQGTAQRNLRYSGGTGIPEALGPFAAAIWPLIDADQATGPTLQEIANVLAPEGRLLTALRPDTGGISSIAARLAPLRVASMTVAQAIDGSWSVVEIDSAGPDAVVFVEGRRSNAPDR